MYKGLVDKIDNLSEARLFCHTAAEIIARRIVPEKYNMRYNDQLCFAAAAMANYRKALKSAADASDLKAGDITVKDCSNTAVMYSKELYENAISDIDFMLKPKRFAFVSTKGDE
jgi:hypothetical protein